MSEFPTFFSFDVETTATVVEAGELRVCCASALGVAVFVSADLVINPSQTMRIETSA